MKSIYIGEFTRLIMTFTQVDEEDIPGSLVLLDNPTLSLTYKMFEKRIKNFQYLPILLNTNILEIHNSLTVMNIIYLISGSYIFEHVIFFQFE